MKVMISQPMRGLSQEQIKQNRESAVKRIESEGNTFVDSLIAETPPESDNQALWYLGKALEKMAQCDGVFFLEGWEDARGCRIEHAVAVSYGLWIKEE